MTNTHCDFVSIEKAYDLIERLNITKTEFARLCQISRQQLRHWEKKGRMPEYRLSQLKISLYQTFKEEFDSKMKIIEEL